MKYCMKCGTKLPDDAVFCSKCGAKCETVEEEKKEKTTAVVEELKTESSLKTVDWVKYLFFSLFCIVSILLIVGLFGDVFEESASILGFSQTQSQGIDYFFGKGGENIGQIKDAYPNDDSYYTYCLITFLFHNIVYFLAVVGVITFSIIAMYKGFMSIKENTEFETKHIKRAAISAVPYVSYTAMLMLTKAKTNTGYGMMNAEQKLGWGTGLLLASIIVTIVLLSLHDVIRAAQQKKQVISVILSRIAGIILIILAMVSFGLMVSMKEDGANAKINSFYGMSTYLQEYSQDSGNQLASYFVLAFFAPLLAVIGSSIFETASTSVFDDKRPFVPLFMIGSGMLFNILSSVFTISFIKQYYAERSPDSNIKYGLAGGSIVCIVLSIVAGALIALSIFLGKKEQKQ